MSEYKNFECPITKYSLEYVIDIQNHSALIKNINTDFVHLKAFVSLLRNSIDTLKKNDVKKIRQFVNDNDWKYLSQKNTSWNRILIMKQQDLYLIECPIEDFLENFGIGIGLYG